jgi:predicted CXXCH cytochrome family protein
MKKIFKHTLVFASLALLAGAASAQIKDTPHNLTTTGTNQVNMQSSTQQICVFCHTPHAANTGVTAPLWNKGTPPATSYQQYTTANSSTIDGQVLAVGSVSAACLSCHDGTQAMDNLVNAPGSGGLNASGSNQNYVWTQGSEKITSAVANLGTDLRNDHPIGIEYCGGGLSKSVTASTSCADKDFKSISTKDINNVPVFWVDVSLAGQRNKTDIILYSREFSSGANRPSVECASCHDPHVAKGSGDVNFMRVTTAGSAICLACHTK